jgi:hypothetical protein
MAFAFDVWHVNAFGRSYQGAEQWTMGFWLGKEDGDAGVPTEFQANQIHTHMATMFGAANNGISWAFVLDGVKIAKWDSTGIQDTTQTVFSDGIASQMGGEQRNQIPQAALAVSFRGSVARGPGANGRMYIPGFVNIPTVSGHIEQADVNEIGTLCDTMFTAINADLAASAGEYLILASKGTAGPPAIAPRNVRVTNLRIGDVTDTIQRRRNGLRENYSLYPLGA